MFRPRPAPRPGRPPRQPWLAALAAGCGAILGGLRKRRPGPVGDGARTADMASRFGDYHLEGEIGQGAAGSVHRARDTATGRIVALKTLPLAPADADDVDLAELCERFAREASTAQRLHHPDIVQIYAAGQTPTMAWLAMELLPGRDLSRHTAPGRLLPIEEVLKIVRRVALALAHAHAQGVVHRDIKPANLMADAPTDMVKVTDFGIARVADASRTRTGMVLGTPSYMSPEQMAGGRVDGRSDLYSLGVVLFELLTGHLPFEDSSMPRLMARIATEPAPDVRCLRPELPQALADIVSLALEKRPEMRYGDGRQFAEDLQAIEAMWAAAVNSDPGPAREAGRAAWEPRHNS